MAITLVQKAKNTSTGSSIAATWSSTTTNGNLLLILVSGVNTTDFTITTPANFQAVDEGVHASAPFVHAKIFYRENAPASSGSQSVGFSAAIQGCSIELAEYLGIASSGSLDQHANNNGNSSNPDSGSTPSTTQPSELWVAVLANGNTNNTFSSPTNGFTIEDTANSVSSGTSQAFLDKIVSGTGSADTSATSSGTGAWAGAIGTFVAAAASFPFGRGPDRKKRRKASARRKRPAPAWLPGESAAPWSDTLFWSLLRRASKRKELHTKPRRGRRKKQGHVQLFPFFPFRSMPRPSKRWRKRPFNDYAAWAKPPASLLPGPLNMMWATALIQETQSATALVQESLSGLGKMMYPP
jgi:hypothetical protein